MLEEDSPPKKKRREKITLVIRSLVYFLLSRLWAVAEPTWKSEGTQPFIRIDY